MKRMHVCMQQREMSVYDEGESVHRVVCAPLGGVLELEWEKSIIKSFSKISYFGVK